jgi:lipopolysaccharide/colanic/teichoic acid biosynthesis glycosyltransferase
VRFTVRPGITGLAQISGRNDLSWDRRLEKDIQYARSLSFGCDVKILCDTVLYVLRRDGYQADPNAIMLDFDAERRLQSGDKE